MLYQIELRRELASVDGTRTRNIRIDVVRLGSQSLCKSSTRWLSRNFMDVRTQRLLSRSHVFPTAVEQFVLGSFVQSARKESNLQPSPYKGGALTTEPHAVIQP